MDCYFSIRELTALLRYINLERSGPTPLLMYVVATNQTSKKGSYTCTKVLYVPTCIDIKRLLYIYATCEVEVQMNSVVSRREHPSSIPRVVTPGRFNGH